MKKVIGLFLIISLAAVTVANAGTVGIWELDESAGSTVTADASGNGNDGVVTGDCINGDGTATFSGNDQIIIEGNPDNDNSTPGIFDKEDFKLIAKFTTEASFTGNEAMALLGTRQVDQHGFLIYLANWGGAGSVHFWVAPDDKNAPGIDNGWYRLSLTSVLEASHDYTLTISLIAGNLGITVEDHTDASFDSAFAVDATTGEEVNVGTNYKYYPGGDLYIGNRGADGWNKLMNVTIDTIRFETAPNIIIDKFEEYIDNADLQSRWTNSTVVVELEEANAYQGQYSMKADFGSAATLTKKVAKTETEYYSWDYNGENGKKFVLWYKGDAGNAAADLTIDIISKDDGIGATTTIANAAQATDWNFIEIPVDTTDPNDWVVKEFRLTTNGPAVLYIDDMGIVAPNPPAQKIINWKFDEASGTTVTDSTGNGFTGTLDTGFSDASWVSGKFGNALDFTTDPNCSVSSDLIELTEDMNDIFDGTSSWTINQWIKPRSISAFQVMGGFGYGSPTEIGVQRYLSTGSNGMVGFFGGGAADIITGTDFDIDQWQMITITYDKWEQEITFYKNAVRIGAGDRVLATAEAYFRVGPRKNENGLTPFDGLIDEFCVWDQPLPFSDNDEDDSNDILSLWGSWVCDESPEFDYNEDCVVDIQDFAIFASQWMQCGRIPESFCD